MKTRRLFVAAALTLCMTAVQAAEISHFAPGVLNIRDYAVPAPGFYLVVYNYGYSTDRLNDPDGNQVSSVTIGPAPGPSVTLGVDVDVDAYVLAPTFIWVSPWKVLGAKYAAYFSVPIQNTSIGASLSSATGAARSADASQFAVGDAFFQPLWLGWTKEHWDFAFGYGIYAATGEYETETITLPVVGPVTVEAADNIGYGFWTHQLQGAVSWYPWKDQRMAVSAALTYELNGDKQQFDLKPGQNLTLSWGVSQYLPLKKDHTLLLELGLAGYDSRQTTDDSGSDATTPAVKDAVDAAGVQIGLTHVPGKWSLNLRYMSEYDSEDRFQGESIGLNFGIKF